MSDFSDEFKRRTKHFAISIINLSKSFPKIEEAFIIKKQLLLSTISVARITGQYADHGPMPNFSLNFVL